MTATLRPRPGYALVKARDDLSHRFRSTVLFSAGSPTKGVFVAEVLACARDVDEVCPGDIVLVQAMSGPEGQTDLRGDFLGGDRDDRLSLVPVLKRTPPAQRREEEFALRFKRLEANRKQWPAVNQRPEALAALMAEDERETRAIRASRKGRARSRLLSWGRDQATIAEGILAVIEPD